MRDFWVFSFFQVPLAGCAGAPSASTPSRSAPSRLTHRYTVQGSFPSSLRSSDESRGSSLWLTAQPCPVILALPGPHSLSPAFCLFVMLFPLPSRVPPLPTANSIHPAKASSSCRVRLGRTGRGGGPGRYQTRRDSPIEEWGHPSGSVPPRFIRRTGLREIERNIGDVKHAHPTHPAQQKAVGIGGIIMVAGSGDCRCAGTVQHTVQVAGGPGVSPLDKKDSKKRCPVGRVPAERDFFLPRVVRTRVRGPGQAGQGRAFCVA
jgi:hypothetical protein